MGWLAGLMMVGTFLSAYGQKQQGKAEREAADFQASLLERNANEVLQQNKEDERKFRIETTKLFGQSRAAIGASGIRLEGSPLDVLQQNARTAELDALQLRHQGKVKARDLRDQAELVRRRGKAAEQFGNIQAASTLIGGGARAFLSYGG